MITAINQALERVDDIYRHQQNAIRVHYHGIKNSQTIDAYTRIAGGKRINNASDDAAGLFIAGRMKAQISGLERAVKNTYDGVSLVNAASLASMKFGTWFCGCEKLLFRWQTVFIRTIRSHMLNGIDQLLQQIDLIAVHANFNGVKLLDGTFQVLASKQNQPEMNGPHILKTTPQLV